MTAEDLPALNALLNGIAAVLLTSGYWCIRQRRIIWHRRMMLAAFGTSVLFLMSYVTYHAQVGSKPFGGTGLVRAVYFAILVPHVLLAAAVLPLAIVTLRRGLARRDAAHRRLARVTLPIWLFVSVTGVLVYLMLYRWF